MELLAKAQCERSRAGFCFQIWETLRLTHISGSLLPLLLFGHLRMDGPCDSALLLGLMRLLWKLLSSPPRARAFLGSQGSGVSLI